MKQEREPLTFDQMYELPDSPDRAVMVREEMECLLTFLQTLTPREELILRARFGSTYGIEKTLKNFEQQRKCVSDGIEKGFRELSQELGVCSGRVSQLARGAMVKLRRKYQIEDVSDFSFPHVKSKRS